MKQKKLFLVCNSHLDPIYLWQQEEGVAEAISTFRTAVSFCEEYDGFVFNHNEALLYEYVREHEPDLFARIQKMVKAGRWHIMGGWYLQPDCNIPSGESFVRQIFAGKNYFKRYFDVEPTTAINFDSFGHNRGLVQILKKSGYDSYLFCRPGVQEYPPLANSDDFCWVGFDNSEIMAHRSSEHYNSGRGYARREIEEWLETHRDEHQNQDSMLFLWGIGDHGGGPSRVDIEALKQLKEERTDLDIIHATPEDYFKELWKRKDQLPVISDDLNPVAQGSYSTLVRTKQKHRQLENAIYMAEKMLSHASAEGLTEYPAQKLEEAQKDLLLAEFHDTMAGSIIPEAEEDVLRFLDHGLETARRLQFKAFFALMSGQPPMDTGKTPILVYNPHPYAVTGIFECEYGLPQDHNAGIFEGDNLRADMLPPGDVIIYPTVYYNGKAIPSQLEQHHSHKPFEWRKRSVFYATLPPYSMSRFECHFAKRAKKPVRTFEQPQGDIILENADMSVRIGRKTGLLESYCVHGKEYLSAGAFLPLVVEDLYDAYGWGARTFNHILGQFRMMNEEEAKSFTGFENAPGNPLRIVENGEVRTVIQALFIHEHSQLCITYKIPRYGTRIEVQMTIYWNEKGRMLKLSIPTALKNAEYMGQTAFGVQKYPHNHEEVCSHKWAGLFDSAKDTALAWGCDSGYGSDCSDDGEIRITLLRSPLYLSAEYHPTRPCDKNRFYLRSDLGERNMNFWLDAGSADELKKNVDRNALAWQEKPYILSLNPSGEGNLPKSFLQLEDSSIQMIAVKQAESGKGYVIRLFESAGQAAKTVLTSPLAQTEIELEFVPFEIKTVLFNPDTKEWKVQEELCV